MKQRNFIRILAVLLTMVVLAAPVSANTGQRLAVEREVYEYLTNELKLSTAAACGVLANIEHESNFQPTIFGDQGTSYGLCQWHNERFSALRGYCGALGLDYRTVEGQMAYLRYELGTNYTTLLLTLQSLDNTPESAFRAAYLWCVHFEKPSNTEAKALARGELARGKYWARYQSYHSITIVPETTPQQPDPEDIIAQLRQDPVTIPLPPEVPQERTMRYVFQRPEMIRYIPHHLPPSEAASQEPADTRWCIPTLGAIFAAMIVVVVFPTKKGRSPLYRQGKDMVK